MGIFKKKQSPPTRRARHLEHDSVGSGVTQQPTFQRNRTLTGSLSSGVRGVSERHAELKSPRVQTHDLRHHRRKLLFALFGALAIVITLGFLIYESIALPKVTITNAPSANTLEYEAKIQDYLRLHPFERSRLTLNTEQLTTYLQENGVPELDSISPELTYAGFGASKIRFYVRKPVVSWATGFSTLYVDVQGNAFSKNYFSTPPIQVVDQTGIQAQDNQVLVSNRFLAFIGKAVGRLSEQGYTVTQIVLPANTTRQISVSLDGIAYPVKMTVDRPAGEQAEDAARSIKYLTGKGIQPSEYIDIRVSGRAYYK